MDEELPETVSVWVVWVFVFGAGKGMDYEGLAVDEGLDVFAWDMK